MTRIVIVGAALALTACAIQTGEAPAPKAPVAPIVVDSFCQTAKKRPWSVRDTPETVKEALAWNRAIDKRCQPSGKRA